MSLPTREADDADPEFSDTSKEETNSKDGTLVASEEDIRPKKIDDDDDDDADLLFRLELDE